MLGTFRVYLVKHAELVMDYMDSCYDESPIMVGQFNGEVLVRVDNNNNNPVLDPIEHI